MTRKKLILFWTVFAALLLGAAGLYYGQVLRPANGVHFLVAPLFAWVGVAQLGDFFPSLESKPLSEGSRVLSGIDFILLGITQLVAAYDLWLWAVPLLVLEIVLLLWIWQRERAR